MKNKYSIYSGDLSFESNSMMINDNHPKWIRFINISIPILAIIVGIAYLINFYVHHTSFKLWTGLLFIILGIAGFIFQFKISYDNKLDFRNIKKVRIKNNLFNLLIADFYLSNKRKRRVILDQNELCRFEKKSLNDFVKTLDNNSIHSEIS